MPVLSKLSVPAFVFIDGVHSILIFPLLSLWRPMIVRMAKPLAFIKYQNHNPRLTQNRFVAPAEPSFAPIKNHVTLRITNSSHTGSSRTRQRSKQFNFNSHGECHIEIKGGFCHGAMRLAKDPQWYVMHGRIRKNDFRVALTIFVSLRCDESKRRSSENVQ